MTRSRASAKAAETCKHCGEPIRHRPTDNGTMEWIHTHGLFSCQSAAIPYGHTASPNGEPCTYPCIGARE